MVDDIKTGIENHYGISCSGKNTGCDHESNPNIDQCLDCIYVRVREKIVVGNRCNRCGGSKQIYGGSQLNYLMLCPKCKGSGEISTIKTK